MPVFISYRRTDALGIPPRLADHLRLQLEGAVFIDEALEPGADWREELIARVRGADVVLVVIGRAFADAATERSRALDRAAEDVVVLELETAFAARRTVIPVLVDGADMPTADDLPLALGPLVDCQAQRVALGQSWDRDVRALAAHIEELQARPPADEPVAPEPHSPRPQGRDRVFERVAEGVAAGEEVIVLGPEFNRNDPGNGVHALDASGLARRLAKLYDVGGDVDDLAWVSQQVDAMRGRTKLDDALQAAVVEAARPTPAHRALARMSGRLRETRGLGHLIVTLNYDTALEQAFKEERVPYDLAVFVLPAAGQGHFLHVSWDRAARVPIAEANAYTGFPIEVNKLRRTIIVKLQGGALAAGLRSSIGSSYVVTEDDHLDPQARGELSDVVPAQILGKLSQSSFLLLGFPLRDWTARVFLQRVWNRGIAGTRSAAVSHAFEEAEYNLWGRLNVDVIESGVGAFVERLELVVDEQSAGAR